MAYVHSEKDILKLVTTLITNTKGEGKGGDPFWEKAETLLLTALIGYIHYHMLEEEQNFSILLDMLNASGYPQGTYEMAMYIEGKLADSFSFELTK